MVNGDETISNLPEAAQQKARGQIEGLKFTLKECDEYLTRYMNADANVGKTAGSLLICSKVLEEAAGNLVALHQSAKAR